VWAAAVVAGEECGPWLGALRETGIAITFSWLVLCASEGGRSLPGRLLELPPMRYLGRISYGVYLLHAPVWYLVVAHLGSGQELDLSLRTSSVGLVALGATLVIGLAALMFQTVEAPIHRFRRSFPYRRPH
jgi:peptidoglycan/LPS O-acetylase OafA/YrhL